MKPRLSEAPLLTKAREIEQRLNNLQIFKEEENNDNKSKIVSCLKRKGGAASLKECADACGVSPDKCKKIIDEMDNVQISSHGDVVLTDGLSDEEMEKAGCVPSHKMAKADMATKDKYCMKTFGKKYSECSAAQKAQCDKIHGKVSKAQPGYQPEKITDINPAFMAESGGQTKSGYFTTNGKTIETEDAPKKKKGKDTTNIEQLSSRMNPHAGGGVDREDRMGESKKLEKASSKALMREMSEQQPRSMTRAVPTICRTCGATQSTGCRIPELMGTDLHACPQFRPL